MRRYDNNHKGYHFARRSFNLQCYNSTSSQSGRTQSSSIIHCTASIDLLQLVYSSCLQCTALQAATDFKTPQYRWHPVVTRVVAYYRLDEPLSHSLLNAFRTSPTLVPRVWVITSQTSTDLDERRWETSAEYHTKIGESCLGKCTACF